MLSNDILVLFITHKWQPIKQTVHVVHANPKVITHFLGTNLKGNDVLEIQVEVHVLNTLASDVYLSHTFCF